MSSGPSQFGILEQRLNALGALVDSARELASQHDLDEILRVVTDGVRDGLDCERSSLFLYDEANRELYTRVTTHLEIAEIRSSIDSGITGWVARYKEVSNVPDPTSDVRWNSSVDGETGFMTRNILAAPVLSGHDQRLLGVLEVLNKGEGPFNGFDEKLLQAFAAHAAAALERAELLNEVRRSHELQMSIEMGRRIQVEFLPKVLPNVPSYEIAAWWQPAESVSGDYYDWLWLPDGRIGLVVADVSGHGVGPSIIMASLRAMLRVLTRTASDPVRILTLLQETITPDLANGRFITFLFVALDFRTHEIEFVNAGHAPALHFDRATAGFRALEPTGMPLGFPFGDEVHASRRLSLAPGDLLLLGTDGIIEVRNEHDEMFGRERLQGLVREYRKLPAEQLVDALSEAITRFHPAPKPPDDSTLLIVERKFNDTAR